jgi:hypothetical protein
MSIGKQSGKRSSRARDAQHTKPSKKQSALSSTLQATVVKLSPTRAAKGAKLVRVWGAFDDSTDVGDWKRYPVLPNPWPPKDFVTILFLAITVPRIANVAYDLIKAWLDARNARRIRIKIGDEEIEIQGVVSERELKKKIVAFRKLRTDVRKDEIGILQEGGRSRSRCRV